MRKAYTTSAKAEAVALAVTAGAEYASEQLGIDVRTVRGWAAKAGKAPELAAPVTGWKNVLDLAMARVSSALAGNTVRPKEAAIIAAIASRNIREPKAGDPTRAAEEAMDRARQRYGICAVIALRVANRMGEPLDDLITALAEGIGDHGDPSRSTQGWEELALIALQDYHVDHGCELEEGNRQQWRNDCPAPLDNIWTYLESLGDLEEWHRRRTAESHAAMVAQLEVNRIAREAATTASLDAETRGLLAAAEEWLARSQETSDAA